MKKTYRLESTIGDDGVIVLPQNMKGLKRHRVKRIVVDLEPSFDSPVNLLADITRRYAAANEEDFDIAGIYEQREQEHGRENRKG